MHKQRASVFSSGLLFLLLPFSGPAWGQTLRFTCDFQGVFHPALTLADLESKFGKENVVAAEIYVGEGMYESGTILFPDRMGDRVEIFWKDRVGMRNPETVLLRIEEGVPSRWRGPLDVPPQIRLKRLEVFNRKPFRIYGFGWDGGGSLVSWSGGEFDRLPDTPCNFGVRLLPSEKNPPSINPGYGSVDVGVFSSGHPAMQAIDPVATIFGLSFRGWISPSQ